MKNVPYPSGLSAEGMIPPIAMPSSIDLTPSYRSDDPFSSLRSMRNLGQHAPSRTIARTGSLHTVMPSESRTEKRAEAASA